MDFETKFVYEIRPQVLNSYTKFVYEIRLEPNSSPGDEIRIDEMVWRRNSYRRNGNSSYEFNEIRWFVYEFLLGRNSYRRNEIRIDEFISIRIERFPIRPRIWNSSTNSTNLIAGDPRGRMRRHRHAEVVNSIGFISEFNELCMRHRNSRNR